MSGLLVLLVNLNINLKKITNFDSNTSSVLRHFFVNSAKQS